MRINHHQQTDKLTLTWHDVARQALAVRDAIETTNPALTVWKVYPVPRGGIFAMQALQAACLRYPERWQPVFVMTPEEADVIVDDIIDSGATKDFHVKTYNKPFVALVDKIADKRITSTWIEFPWEVMTEKNGPEENIVRLLQFIGEDPAREGLRDTPKRVLRSYAELFGGYSIQAADLLTVFEDGACDEMVVVRDIEFTSMCEHHMMPFMGRAHIGYLPDGKVIGVSKLARLLDMFARRLQIQERMTQSVVETLDKYLEPLGSACIVEAQHLCMQCRGVRKQSSTMVTSSLSGNFRQAEVRGEFLRLIGK